MSNHKILFFGAEGTDTDNHNLECYANYEGFMWIEINMEDLPPSYILLDKPTAIKFAKTLRTEINKMPTDNE